MIIQYVLSVVSKLSVLFGHYFTVLKSLKAIILNVILVGFSIIYFKLYMSIV